jgi:hypothetical protein
MAVVYASRSASLSPASWQAAVRPYQTYRER